MAPTITYPTSPIGVAVLTQSWTRTSPQLSEVPRQATFIYLSDTATVWTPNGSWLWPAATVPTVAHVSLPTCSEAVLCWQADAATLYHFRSSAVQFVDDTIVIRQSAGCSIAVIGRGLHGVCSRVL